jgi:hypothetical protein
MSSQDNQSSPNRSLQKNPDGSFPNSQNILDESARERANYLRTKTQENRFLNEIRKNLSTEIAAFLSNHEFSSEQDKMRVTTEAVRYALENDNEDLAQSIKDQGYEVSGALLLSSITERNEKVINGLVKLHLYSDLNLQAYFWYLVSEGFLLQALELANSNNQLSHFAKGQAGNMTAALTDVGLAEAALQQGLTNKCDELTQKIIQKNPELAIQRYMYEALENDCVGCLRMISMISNPEMSKTLSRSQGGQDSNMNNAGKTEKQEGVLQFLEFYTNNNKLSLVKKIALWPEAGKLFDVLNFLILNNLESIATDYVSNFDKKSSSKDFFTAFDKGMYELCLVMLASGVPRVNLNSPDFQRTLINQVASPEKCLQCIEILAEISEKDWISSMTKELLEILSNFAKKTDNIIFVKKPILYCVKVMEFLEELSQRDYEYRAKCISLFELYKSLAIELQDEIKGENDLKFYMMHEDSKGENTLYIIAKNKFNELLVNEDIGTIVEKFWEGEKNSYSIFEASSVYLSFNSGVTNPDSQTFMSGMNKLRAYSFQYGMWLDSCSFRFFSQGISTAVLVLIYQILIYRTFEMTSLYDIGNNSETKVYFRLVQAWIFCILVEQFLHFIHVTQRKRKSLINPWRFVDIITFVLMILISNDFSGNYVEKNFSENKDDDTAPGVLLSLLMFFIWLRFASVMIVTKTYGQFLRIIYYMIGETINFFIILIALFVCASGVFTACFYLSNPTYVSFDISLRTVFADAMGGFDMTKFTNHIALGSSFQAFYLMISNVVLLNLLIAIISSVYETLVQWVDSEHRNVIISYTEKYRWDENLGFLIYMPSPFAPLVLCLTPFVLNSKDRRRWNDRLCRWFYLVYAIGLLAIFFSIGMLYSIPLYFKGFGIYSMRKTSNPVSDDAEETVQIESKYYVRPPFSKIILRSVIWLFIGLPLIFWAVLRDSFDFLRILYKEAEVDEENKQSVKFDTFLNANFLTNMHLALDSITQEEVTIQEMIDAWKLFDESNVVEFDEELSMNRLEEVEEFFRQFLTSHKSQTILVEFVRKMLPKVRGDLYDELYIDRARYLNASGLSKATRNFHAGIGALNISGVTIPKPEPDETFDMERVNALNNSIKELDDLYIKLLRYSSLLVKNYEENSLVK